MDPTVGFVITVKPGDPVRAGEPIASVFARDEAGIAVGMQALKEAVTVGETGTLTPLDLTPDHGARRGSAGGRLLTCRW